MLPFPNLLIGPSAAVGSGPTPTYLNNGGWSDNATSVTNPTPGYPSGLAGNDILFLQVLDEDASGDANTVDTPAGWTLVASQAFSGVGAVYLQNLYWKRATGSESGTVTVTRNPVHGGTDTFGAIITAFRGCRTSGTPYEGLATNDGNNANMNGAAVTTTGANRLVCHFCVHSNPALGSNSFATPAAGWTEQYDISTLSGNEQGGVELYTKARASAGTESAATHVLDASDLWQTMALALIPA